MAEDTELSGAAQPEVTITCGHPQRYSYTVVLRKPMGETWPDGHSGKIIMSGVFDKQNIATESTTINQPGNTLDGYSLEWVVFIKVPGGGMGQYSVTVEVTQNGITVGGPFNKSDPVDDVETVSDFSDFKVN